MLQIVMILAMFALLARMDKTLQNRFSERVRSFILWTVFVVYIAGNLYFTLFSRNPSPNRTPQLIPFASYCRLFEPAKKVSESLLKGWLAQYFLQSGSVLQGIILNILLYFPLGYLLPLLFQKQKDKQIILIALAATVCTELIQYISELGWCEVDDVVHNTLGAIIGLISYRKQFGKSKAEL